MNITSSKLKITGLIAILFFCSWSYSSQSPHKATVRKSEPRTMLNGDWIIDSKAVQSSKPRDSSFVPSGLHVQLKILGPTRRAIEEHADELSGELMVLPPFPDGLCSTELGKWICKDGVIPGHSQPAKMDVVFSFDLWSRKFATDQEGTFFFENGARAGAQFVHIMAIPVGWPPVFEWQLWMRDHNDLVGSYWLGDLQDKHSDAEEIEQTWRRQTQTK